MKVAFISGGIGLFAFVLMAMQTGVLDFSSATDDDEEAAPVEPKAPPAPVALKFPEALAPAIRGNAVPQAASYVPEARPHRMVFLKPTGLIHDWQEHLHDDWAADSVENTELVIVVSPQQKTFLSVQRYPNGAPPVERFQYDLEVAVIVPKEGRVLIKQRFQSIPRPIKNKEAWELTAIGQPVAFRTVYSWLSSRAQTGFPQEYFKVIQTIAD